MNRETRETIEGTLACLFVIAVALLGVWVVLNHLPYDFGCNTVFNPETNKVDDYMLCRKLK